MNRRDFLKTAVAAAVVSQIPIRIPPAAAPIAAESDVYFLAHPGIRSLLKGEIGEFVGMKFIYQERIPACGYGHARRYAGRFVNAYEFKWEPTPETPEYLAALDVARRSG